MMPWLRRLGWLFQRKQKESDLEEELRFHLEEEAAARRDDGASEAAARRAARIDLGNPAVIAEDTRAAWGWTLWEQLAQDVRYAFRTMKRSRAFSTVAIVSLALGIPHLSPKASGHSFEIVGVAHDVRYGGITAASEPLVYFPFSSSMGSDIGQMVFEIRTTAAPASHVRAIRDIVRDANPGVPILRVATQAELIDRTIGRQKLLARLCAVFALLALTIAVAGLYGTVAYDVARRTAEIGIRIALGAGRGRVLVMVLGDVLLLVVTGVAIGIPAALGASRFTRSFLFGLTSDDPPTLVLAVCVLLGAALAASYLPARAASRLDPTTALRHE